jgi:HlyD family secretion protein
MPKKISKRALKWIIVAAGVLIVGFIGFKYWKKKQTALPEGIVSGNGRLEAKLSSGRVRCWHGWTRSRWRQS